VHSRLTLHAMYVHRASKSPCNCEACAWLLLAPLKAHALRGSSSSAALQSLMAPCRWQQPYDRGSSWVIKAATARIYAEDSIAAPMLTSTAYVAYLVILQLALGDGTRLQRSNPFWIQPMRCIAVADSSLSMNRLSSQRQVVAMWDRRVLWPCRCRDSNVRSCRQGDAALHREHVTHPVIAKHVLGFTPCIKRQRIAWIQQERSTAVADGSLKFATTS